EEERRADKGVGKAAALETGDRQGAEHADSDEGGNPADAASGRRGELPAPRLDETHERRAGRAPTYAGRIEADVAHCYIRSCAGIGMLGASDDTPVVTHVAAAGRGCTLGLGSHQPPVWTVTANQLGMTAAFDHAFFTTSWRARGADPVRGAVCQD